MDPEMVRQQRHEETLTLEAQENGGAHRFEAEAASAPLISRLFASQRTGTSLVPLPRREIVAPRDAGCRDIAPPKRGWRRKALPARISGRLAGRSNRPPAESNRLTGPAGRLALPPGPAEPSPKYLASPAAKPFAPRWPLILLTTGLLAMTLALTLNRFL